METSKLAENAGKTVLSVGKKFGEPENGADTVRRFRSPYQQNQEYPKHGVVFFEKSENNLSIFFKMEFGCSENFKNQSEPVQEPKTTPVWVGEVQNTPILDMTL